MKLTKQGVRDLGGIVPKRKRVVHVCPHVWEREVDWYGCEPWWMGGQPSTYLRCGFCGETRR